MQTLLPLLVCCLLALASTGLGGETIIVPDGHRLVSLAPNKRVLVTEAERDRMALAGTPFMDVTDFQQTDPAKAPRSSVLPTEPSHQDILRPLLDAVDLKYFERNLRTLTYFRNRYYNSPHGIESAQWIFDVTTALARPRPEIRVTKFTHAGFSQPSVIALIPGANASEVVIIGAHQDSYAEGMPNGLAPGADDGSGSIGILEIFRILVTGGFVPEYTLEFHWYAAEEVGLLGSQDIARQYQEAQVLVRGMMQLDMIGYSTNDSAVVGIVSDFVDQELTQFTTKLVDTYLPIPWVDSSCGYACSDHASWSSFGYRSSFPFETPLVVSYPHIHTAEDTIDKINLNHVGHFIRLGLAFLVELSFL